MKRFFDTCSLLTDCSDLSDVVLSSKTIEELENIKTSYNKDSIIKYKARKAVRAIKSQNPEVIIVNKNDYATIESLNLEVTNDNLIIACASRIKEPIEFYTEDYLCEIIAREYFGLTVKHVENSNRDNIYMGFKIISPTDEELSTVYSKDNCENIFNCLINEYVIINDENDNFCDVIRWNGVKYETVWNKTLKTLAFGDKIKSKDVYQRMAFDSLLNNTMTCITGHAGSGKSLISLVTAMHLIETGKYDRIVILFNPCPVKEASQMGYYQGSLIDKAMQSNIGNMLITKFGDRFAVDNYIAQGKIKLIPMTECRGMEICDNEILYITEAENTTANLMKICLSRVSSGAKVIIEGDFQQTDDKKFDCENGMSRAIDVLKGEKEFGYIQLQNVWRSKIAMLVDKM